MYFRCGNFFIQSPTHTYTHAHSPTCTCTHSLTLTQTHAYLYTHAHAHTYEHTHLHTYLYTHIPQADQAVVDAKAKLEEAKQVGGKRYLDGYRG